MLSKIILDQGKHPNDCHFYWVERVQKKLPFKMKKLLNSHTGMQKELIVDDDEIPAIDDKITSSVENYYFTIHESNLAMEN